jgi:hypothetical protein
MTREPGGCDPPSPELPEDILQALSERSIAVTGEVALRCLLESRVSSYNLFRLSGGGAPLEVPVPVAAGSRQLRWDDGVRGLCSSAIAVHAYQLRRCSATTLQWFGGRSEHALPPRLSR